MGNLFSINFKSMVSEKLLDDGLLCPVSSLARVYHGLIHDTDDTIQFSILFGKEGIDITVRYARGVSGNITMSGITCVILQVHERSKIIKSNDDFSDDYVYNIKTLCISLYVGDKCALTQSFCCECYPTRCTKSTDSCECKFNIYLPALLLVALNCGYAVTKDHDGSLILSLPVNAVTPYIRGSGSNTTMITA